MVLTAGAALALVAGIAIAMVVMTRRAVAGKHTTTADGVGWGTLSAFLGWFLLVAFLVIILPGLGL